MNSKLLQFGGVRLRLDYQGKAASQLVDTLFSHLPDPPKSSRYDEPDFSYRLIYEPGTRELCLYAGDTLEASYSDLADMAAFLLNQTFHHLVKPCTSGVMLHAGCISYQGRGVLLPGDTGSGKSTLSAWLVQQGFDFLTDELTFIPQGTQAGQGLTLPFNFKSDAGSLLTDVFRIKFDNQTIIRNAKFYFVPPELMRTGPTRSETRIVAIVLPNFSKPDAASIQPGLFPVPKGQAGLKMMQQLVNGRNLPGDGFPEITRLVRELPAYKLVYSDYRGVREMIGDLVSGNSG